MKGNKFCAKHCINNVLGTQNAIFSKTFSIKRDLQGLVCLRSALYERVCTHGKNWDPGRYAFILNEYFNQQKTWKESIQQDLKTLRSEAEKKFAQDAEEYEFADLVVREYASDIFNAVFDDRLRPEIQCEYWCQTPIYHSPRP